MLLKAATIALIPALIIQGNRVKKNTIKLPEPEGAREGQTGTGKKLSLLIVGDSAAAGVGVDYQDDALLGAILNELKNDFEIEWKLQAKTGDTTSKVIRTLDQIEAKSYDVVVTSVGVNDVTKLMPADVWIKNLSIGPDKVQVDGLSRLWSGSFAKLATSTNNTWSEVGRITFTPYAAGSKILVIGSALLSVIETSAFVPVGIMRVLINGAEVFRRSVTADRKTGGGAYATEDWVSIVAMGVAVAGSNTAVVQVISGSDNYTVSLDQTKLFVTEFKR
mgnify:CR=1 FL=1